MSFIAKNPISAAEITSLPPVPIKGTRGIFAKKDGWYEIDDNGNVKKLGSDSGGGSGSYIPLEAGDGINSVQTPDVSKAIGDYSFAFGDGNIAGLKAYYIRSIDIVNKKIYLSNTQYATPEVSETDYTDESFETPAYEIGDAFNIIIKPYTTHRMQLHFISNIVSIQNNVIGYDNELPLTELFEDTEDYSNTLCVAYRPNVGIVDIGGYSSADGQLNFASGKWSHVEGFGGIAAGMYSHVEGCEGRASYASHSEGSKSYADGNYSHAEGNTTNAKGDYSHAEGLGSIAEGKASHSEGVKSEAKGRASHSEGEGSIASGDYSHAEGTSSVASGKYSHAENKATASGEGSHAEANSTASGVYAHAEGNATTSSGKGAHSEGRETQAKGDASHTEGYQTEAKASYSHAEGRGTIASCNYQHVQGRYNIEDTSATTDNPQGTYAHIIGNGTGNTKRKNIYTLDWEGNGWFAGEVRVGTNTAFANGVKIESREDGLYITYNGKEHLLYAKDFDGVMVDFADYAGFADFAELDGEGRVIVETYATKDELQELEPQIIDDFDYEVIDWELTNNSMTYHGIASSVIVTVSGDEKTLGFSAALYFATPSEIPENYSQFPADIYFKGDSTDNGAFVPEANMRYTIVFDFDGYMLNGYVSGVSTI